MRFCPLSNQEDGFNPGCYPNTLTTHLESTWPKLSQLKEDRLVSEYDQANLELAMEGYGTWKYFITDCASVLTSGGLSSAMIFTLAQISK